jgi:hypothetical protein
VEEIGVCIVLIRNSVKMMIVKVVLVILLQFIMRHNIGQKEIKKRMGVR